jgi:GntR family transcriptional repressor for pyruvate dehydrogenase complex
MTDLAFTSHGEIAQRLRGRSLAAVPGDLLGSEESLVREFGCSRNTIRQAARVLERDGLLRVRRGPSGGYFAARPDASTIETAVSAYLETLEMNPREVTVVASALWLEAVRNAAAAPAEARREAIENLRRRVVALKNDASFEQVRNVELLSQEQTFELARSPYIKLIFDINIAFSRKCFVAPSGEDDPLREREFVAAWREAKLVELRAIAEGCADLAMSAGRSTRLIWERRVWAHAAD